MSTLTGKKDRMDQNVYLAPGALVIGEVQIGENSSIWYHATVRGDLSSVIIGKDTNIQDNAVIHVEDSMPVQIGDGVSIGHGAVIHGCRIGNNTLVGMGAIVLNGAKIGRDCLIGAGTLITQNQVIPDGSVVLGSPGKVKRSITEEENKSNIRNALNYANLAKEHQKGVYHIIEG